MTDSSRRRASVGHRTLSLHSRSGPVGRAVSIAMRSAALAPVLLSGGALAASSERTLEEVVVTAQFSQEQNLQQTPLAITAITGDALKDRGIENLTQVGQSAPNVGLNLTGSAFGKSMAARIRGVGQADFNFALEPGVGIYIDDVYHATVAGSVFELLDLDRVEILRGPQGTLFGKNSIGGAIRLVSQKPQGDGSGYVQGSYGTYNRKDLRAMFDIALTENLFLRVSGASKTRDGYVDRLDFACVHPDLGASQGYEVNLSAPRLLKSQRQDNGSCVVGTEGGEDVQAARAALRWHPSDTFEMNFIADWMDDNSEAAATKLLVADGSAQPVWDNQMLANYGVRYDSRFITNSRYTNYSTFYQLNRDRAFPAISEVHSWGVSNAIDWDISEAVHLRFITGYRGYSAQWSDDQDASPLPMAYVYNDIDHHQFSQEIQLTGTAFERLDWATGLFYFDGYSLNRGHVNIDLFNAGPVFDFNQNDPSNIKDKAVFVQGTYHLTDQLGATLGARYTKESKDYLYDHGILIPRRTPLGTEYNKTDYKAGIDYQWTPDLMVYAQVATGFKGGGFNPRPFSAAQVTSFGPETLRSYEAGLKSEWFDNRLRLNLAAFLSKYSDMQLGSQTTDQTGAPYIGTFNVGKADIAGVELEIEVEPIEDLLVNGSVGETDFEYKDLGNAIGCTAVTPIPGPNGTFLNCVTNNPTLDDKPVGLPEWRANLGIQYTLRTGGGTLTPRVDANMVSFANGYTVNGKYPDADIPGYTLVNARLTWAPSNGEWLVAAYVTNATDKEYYVTKFDLRYAGEGMMLGQPGRPREWALEVRRNFGD